MKEKEEILRRIMCLLVYTDRCVLESEVIEGIRHPLKEREDHRKEMAEWLKWKGYYSSFTAKEKRIMETPVTARTNQEILYNYLDYECIEPLLWSVGLKSRLSNYNDYVMADLHPPMKIGPDHTLKGVADSCKVVPTGEIEKKREIAMLWYWRCLEARNANAKNINYKDAVAKTFGETHAALLEGDSGFDKNNGDFVVRGKKVSELSGAEIGKLEVLSERRFYAFEWLCSEEDWDKVDLIC